MGSSLEKFVENLYTSFEERGARSFTKGERACDKDEDEYKNFHSMKQYYNDHMDLLCKKGVYPYEWVDNNEKLNHQGLPDKSDLYSKLSRSGITDEQYNHAQDVYDKLNCKSFLDYHLTYLKM